MQFRMPEPLQLIDVPVDMVGSPPPPTPRLGLTEAGPYNAWGPFVVEVRGEMQIRVLGSRLRVQDADDRGCSVNWFDSSHEHGFYSRYPIRRGDELHFDSSDELWGLVVMRPLLASDASWLNPRTGDLFAEARLELDLDYPPGRLPANRT